MSGDHTGHRQRTRGPIVRRVADVTARRTGRDLCHLSGRFLPRSLRRVPRRHREPAALTPFAKFTGIEWAPGPDGCPVVERLDWFAGSVVDRLDTGDHVGFVVAPWAGRGARAARQLGT